jgi:hypothetical protein
LSSAYVREHVFDLRGELWALMGVFRRFLGSDGTETEQGGECGLGETRGDAASVALTPSV